MTTPRREVIADLFGEAIELPVEERRAYLARAEASEEERREVFELLSMHEQDSGALEVLDVDLAARIVEDDDELASEGSGIAGRRIGRYRVLSRIGSGGMGVVYLAERADDAYDQQVALKLLPPSVLSQGMEGRFVRERQILAHLEHPGIARLLDGGASEHGEPFLVMEYVEGQTLSRFCDERRLSIEKRLELFLQICDAVSYAHGRLVVHRDLKPSNVLVTEEHRVKLLDFGIAKLMAEGGEYAPTALTRAGYSAYTPDYAAPEQRRSEPVSVTTDVYGLGALLYELLCGRAPETGRGETWIAPQRPSTVFRDKEGDALDSEEVAAARSSRCDRLRRQLAGDLDTIALVALREEPQQRYASVHALADDVKRYLEGRPIVARPASSGYRLRKFVGRHRLGVATGLVLALAIMGGLVGTLWQAREATRERDAARLEAAKLAAAQQYLESLFQSAEPRTAKGEELTAKQLVGRGVERIEELADQPVVQLDMATTLARVALVLADLDQAERLLQLALPRAQDLYGPDHLVTADLEALWGRLEEYRGEWSAAEQTLQRAIGKYRRLGGESRWQMVDALTFLGAAVGSQDRPEEVVEIQREAVEASRQVFGERAGEVATGLNQLGILLRRIREFEESREALEEALEISRERHGAEDPQVATILVNLASTLLEQGRLAEAEPYFRQGVQMEIRLRGKDHPRYAVKLHNLATFLHAAGHYEEAVDLHTEVAAVLEKQFGEEHPHVGAALDSLGHDLTAAGRPEEALAHFERADRILLVTAGPESSFYAIHLRLLASTLCDLDRCDEAAVHIDRALEILAMLGVSGSSQLALALGVRARILRSKGALTEAEADLRRALAIQEETLPPGHYGIGLLQATLAEVLLDRGRHEDALPLARRAAESLDASLGEDHPRRIEAREVLEAVESQVW